jgi:hypothetical protein
MTEIVASSSTVNFEKTRPRRKWDAAVASRKQSSRERQVQSVLDPERIASCIALKLLTEYQGRYVRGSRFQLVVALDKLGVIDPRVVKDSAVRLGIIANTLNELIDEKRLLSREDLSRGQHADTIWLSDDERFACESQLEDIARRRDARLHRGS